MGDEKAKNDGAVSSLQLNDLSAIEAINSEKKKHLENSNNSNKMPEYGEVSYEKKEKVVAPQIEPVGKVLVAEDSVPNQKILTHILSKIGLEVVAFPDGQEAWDYFQKPEGQGIQAILSDIMMPKMNGLELLQKVRETEQGKTLPFILVSAVADKQFIETAKGLKVNGYILKPVTFDKVFNKMQAFFPKVRKPVS